MRVPKHNYSKKKGQNGSPKCNLYRLPWGQQFWNWSVNLSIAGHDFHWARRRFSRWSSPSSTGHIDAEGQVCLVLLIYLSTSLWFIITRSKHVYNVLTLALMKRIKIVPEMLIWESYIGIVLPPQYSLIHLFCSYKHLLLRRRCRTSRCWTLRSARHWRSIAESSIVQF